MNVFSTQICKYSTATCWQNYFLKRYLRFWKGYCFNKIQVLTFNLFVIETGPYLRKYWRGLEDVFHLLNADLMKPFFYGFLCYWFKSVYDFTAENRHTLWKSSTKLVSEHFLKELKEEEWEEKARFNWKPFLRHPAKNPRIVQKFKKINYSIR